MRLTDVPRHASGVVSQPIGDEAVLVHPAQGKVRVLNRAGARLWELADGQRSVGDMAQAMADEYGLDLGQAQADALAFCADLMARGVLMVDE